MTETTTGASIVGALLRANGALAGLVPAARLMLGALPNGTALPAILIRVISSVERQPLKPGQVIRTVDRVSVTVRAANYREQTRVIRLVRDACTGKTGAIGGGQSVAIAHAGKGPDLAGPGDSFEQAIDFRVSFDAPTGG